MTYVINKGETLALVLKMDVGDPSSVTGITSHVSRDKGGLDRSPVTQFVISARAPGEWNFVWQTGAVVAGIYKMQASIEFDGYYIRKTDPITIDVRESL